MEAPETATRIVMTRILAAAACLLLAGPAPAADDDKSAHGPKGHHEHRCQMHDRMDGLAPEQMMQQFRDEFGLTGQQQTDIQIIVSDYGERLGDIAKLGRKTAEDLLATDPEDPAYREKTDDAAALAANSAAETVVLLAEMRAKLHAVLTPEQRDTLQRKIEEKKRELEQKKLERQQHEESHDRPMGQFIG